MARAIHLTWQVVPHKNIPAALRIRSTDGRVYRTNKGETWKTQRMISLPTFLMNPGVPTERREVTSAMPTPWVAPTRSIPTLWAVPISAKMTSWAVKTRTTRTPWAALMTENPTEWALPISARMTSWAAKTRTTRTPWAAPMTESPTEWAITVNWSSDERALRLASSPSHRRLNRRSFRSGLARAQSPMELLRLFAHW